MSRFNQVVNFLNTLNSKTVKEAFDTLTVIIEQLELKDDPEPIEMEIVDTAYQVVEKLNLLQTAMRKYRNSESPLTRRTLSDLYDEKHSSGTTSMFED
ncbi:MAG: hypothetical protein ACFFG0_00010 [Candidatus Thorarchaeota archaeon]